MRWAVRSRFKYGSSTISITGTAGYASRYPLARYFKVSMVCCRIFHFDIFSVALYGSGGKVNDDDSQGARMKKILEQPLDSHRGRNK
jgi:hypothetical protein